MVDFNVPGTFEHHKMPIFARAFYCRNQWQAELDGFSGVHPEDFALPACMEVQLFVTVLQVATGQPVTYFALRDFNFLKKGVEFASF